MKLYTFDRVPLKEKQPLCQCLSSGFESASTPPGAGLDFELPGFFTFSIEALNEGLYNGLVTRVRLGNQQPTPSRRGVLFEKSNELQELELEQTFVRLYQTGRRYRLSTLHNEENMWFC